MKTLSIKRESDGKIFEVAKDNKGGWEIIENRGCNGRFNASLSDCLWSEPEHFESRIKAYSWLKNNIEKLL